MDNKRAAYHLGEMITELQDEKRLYTWRENVEEADERIAALQYAIDVLTSTDQTAKSGVMASGDEVAITQNHGYPRISDRCMIGQHETCPGTVRYQNGGTGMCECPYCHTT